MNSTRSSTTNNDHVLETARQYRAAGLSCFAIKTDGSKSPTGPWSVYQDRLPTSAELETMFGGNRVGIAIAGGKGSGNLEILDNDDPALVEPFEAMVNDLAPGLLGRLPTVKTPRDGGGRHYYYRHTGAPEGNLKLAQSEPRPQFEKLTGEPIIDHKTGKQKIAPDTLIETRGHGGYVLAPGCPGACHPTGRTYEHVSGPALVDVPTISEDERNVLLTVAKTFNRFVDEPTAAPTTGTTSGVSPGDDFASKTEWADIITPHGWQRVSARGEIISWRRPGKTNGISATTGLRSKNGVELLCVFSSNAHPFDVPSGRTCGSYCKFAAYALLNHAGDFKAAAKELARQGFGERGQTLIVSGNGQHGTSPRELPLAFTESAWPDPPDERVYHGLAGEFMRMIDPHTEADPIAVLIQFLLAVGNVIGRHAHAVADGAWHYANLFACLVGSTSKGRKGSAFTHVKNLLSQLDSTWSTDHVLGGLSSGEGLIWAIRDPITKTEAIKNKKTGEITSYQQVVVDEGIADKRLLVIEPEFARVITAMSRERNTLSMVLRDAWDTGTLRTITKNSPAVATAGHVSVMGHVTRDELRQQLAVCDQTNGFANRFLWLCVKRSKALPEGGQAHRLNMANIVEALRSVIEFARDVGEMRRDDEARRTWAEVYPILSDGKPGMLGAVTARAEAQVLRLAMLYAILDQSVVVRNQHLLAALALWDYCEESARFIFGGRVGNRTADVILAALKAAPDGLSRTDLRDLFGRNRGAEDIVYALNTLQGLGLVECSRQTTKGHPVEIWRCTAEGTT